MKIFKNVFSYYFIQRLQDEHSNEASNPEIKAMGIMHQLLSLHGCSEILPVYKEIEKSGTHRELNGLDIEVSSIDEVVIHIQGI